MKFEVDPYRGAGVLRFGMTQEEVRLAISAPMRAIRLSPFNEYASDQFLTTNIVVAYCHPGLCNYIEFNRPSSPTFEGTSFVNKPFGMVKRWFEERDPEIDYDLQGFRSYKLGIALHAPEAPRGKIATLSVFERGYYDEANAIQGDGLLVWGVSSVGLIQEAGTGFLQFGMPADHVRQSLGVTFRTLDNPAYDWPSDAFDSLGLTVHYRSLGLCAAVSFEGPAYPNFDGRRLLGLPFSQALRWFTALDPTISASESSFKSSVLGVSALATSSYASVTQVHIFDRSL